MADDLGYGSFADSFKDEEPTNKSVETTIQKKKAVAPPKLTTSTSDLAKTALANMPAASSAIAPIPNVPNPATDTNFLTNAGLLGLGAAIPPAVAWAVNRFKKTPEAIEPPAIQPTPTVEAQPIIDTHQEAVKTETLRKMRLENDLLERKLNPIVKETTPVPEITQAPDLTPQDALARGTPVPAPAAPAAQVAPTVAPSFGKGTDMPLNPISSPTVAPTTVTPEVAKLAPIMDTKTTVLADIATAKPPEFVGPPPELVGPIKPIPPPKKFEGLKKNYASVADIPPGFEFKPGVTVSNMDNFLHSVMGPEHRLYAKELINSGQMFPEVKGLGETGFNSQASKLSREYLTALQGQIPETLHPFKSAFGQLGKAAKVGGVAGTLFALGEAANAKTPSAALRSGGESALAMVPGVGPGAVLYHSPLASGTSPGYDQQYQVTQELLSRPDVRSDLAEAQKQLSPIAFTKFRDDYLSRKIDTEQQKLSKNLSRGIRAPFTGMGVPPPQ